MKANMAQAITAHKRGKDCSKLKRLSTIDELAVG
jgi:hypothetical protein